MTFSADAGVERGSYLETSTVFTERERLGPDYPANHLENCRTETALSHVIATSRGGDVHLSGGALHAVRAVASVTNTQGYVMRLFLSDMGEWRGAILDFPSAPGPTEITIGGVFDSAGLAPFSAQTPTGTSAETRWAGEAIMIVDAEPNGRYRGWPGLKARLRNAGAQGPEWVFRPSDHGRYGEDDQWHRI